MSPLPEFGPPDPLCLSQIKGNREMRSKEFDILLDVERYSPI